MTPQPISVSVTSPVSAAIGRVKRLLFQPFDLGKWFVIGFCAWLAQLGEGGANFRYNFGSWNRRGGGGGREQFEQVRDYVINNLSWILPLAVAFVVLGLSLWVVFTWLSSRGRFMFLHCVALDKAEVEVPWHKFVREGNSLFRFRIVLGLIAMVPMLPLTVLIGMAVFRMVDRGSPSVEGVLEVIGLGLVMGGFGILFAVIAKFTKDFVAPIMFLRGRTAREAWVELLGLLSANAGSFVLYLLFQVVLALAIGAMFLIVVVVTCCIAGCLLALPYLGTVLALPILTFSRCYSLYYLAQFGPQYDVFPPPAPPAPGFPPPPSPNPPVAPA